jgi:hypothetical protein
MRHDSLAQANPRTPSVSSANSPASPAPIKWARCSKSYACRAPTCRRRLLDVACMERGRPRPHGAAARQTPARDPSSACRRGRRRSIREANMINADAPPHWTAANLSGVRHGFFGAKAASPPASTHRSTPAPGSNDDPAASQENRRRIAAAFNAQPDHLLGVHQVHSPTAVFVTGPWTSERPHADALVTTTPGLVISFSPPTARLSSSPTEKANVIGAAHAGWKGAIGGVHRKHECG